MEKKVKNLDNEDEKNIRLEASIAEERNKTNALEETLNRTKALDALKERESELLRKNVEAQETLQALDASPSDKAGAEERVAEINEELARL